ncbi:MAG: N-acetylglucosaminyldiphospho-UDP N-acetyl-beta-D-mannosaminyltransferase [Rhizobacter sp.]|nr:N-acetylglucosaminyldiphospho-UDP N-acetyl-beta-D-mannosaminyltransferase [Rhizobacter sp.]
MDYSRDVWCILGLPFDSVVMQSAVENVRDVALANTRCFISTPNLNFVAMARSDAAFRQSVLASDLSLVDGMPLIWVARLLQIPITERVSGASVFEKLARHSGRALRVYFFGGPKGVAAKACEKLNESSTGLIGVGYDMPGYGSVESMSRDDTIDRINASNADFVVVSLGAKKGQAWIERNRERLTAPLISHMGAVVNFAAGSVRRAPLGMQRLGLEWLWRIKEEPAIWSRYAADGVKLLGMMLTQVLPYAMSLRAGSDVDLDEASLTYTADSPAGSIVLGGPWMQSNLEPLRAALTRCDTQCTALRISLHEVTCVDSALIGLLLLAKGRYPDPNGLAIVGATRKVAAIFRRNGAGYLLRQTAP